MARRWARAGGICAVVFAVIGALLWVVGAVAEMNYLSTILILGGVGLVAAAVLLAVIAGVAALVGRAPRGRRGHR